MSGIAQLFNVPGNRDEAMSWSFAHAADHREIIKSIYDKYGKNLPEYVLDPIPTDNIASWIYHHQQMHNDMNAILGVSGLNLSNVEWKDIQARSSWILSNASEHTQVNGILRLGPNVIPPNVVLITNRSSSLIQANAPAVQQSFTFNGMAVGPANASRYVIVCVGCTANVNNGIANVQLNGNAATALGNVRSGLNSSGMFIGYVPTGTTANIIVNNNSSSTNVGVQISVYSITGITSPAASFTSTSSGVVSPSASFSVNANGAIIGTAINRALGFPTASWSGLTQDTSVPFSFPGSGVGSRSTAASKDFPAFSSVSIVCSFSGGLPQATGCFAAFNP